jgi:DNA replication and repair protein RecF
VPALENQRGGLRLLRLEGSNFRNFEHLELRPSQHTTIVVGENGQGKTNLLEAIFFLATLKALRASKLAELVHFGADSTGVSGRFSIRGGFREISVQVMEGMRQTFVDGKNAPSLEDYFGGVSVVAFTPDDLAVVKGGPEGRRRLLDRAVFNRYPAFLKESRDYARALKSRNRLLREQADTPYRGAYDEALARLGARVWTRRRALLDEMSPRAMAAFEAIARPPAALQWSYEPLALPMRFSETSEENLSAALLELLQSYALRDAERGYTSVGPHADDLRISLGEYSARHFGSQGQQRALVLAWKIAEIENLQAVHGVLPLLLLDDVSSELDPDRNAYLMTYLARSGAQVFLTTTDARLVAPAAGPDAHWYEVRAGRLNRLSGAP